ncbi:MAG: DUF4212 domain-containing protein [Alphaproteobacteria bacterium]|nr:DUF4212 domain-containing protein [Alphaproteobacteria bacterium]
MSNDVAERNTQHWAKTRSLTIFILTLWFIFGMVLPWFARELDQIVIFGWKLGYYFVVQGSLIAFVVMIWYQNWRQDQIDREFGVNDE